MPFVKKYSSKKRRVVRKRKVIRRRQRIPRSVRVTGPSGIPEYASLSVKRSLVGNQPGGGFGAQTMFSLMNTNLQSFPRATVVASAYQFYKIKRISLTFKPSYDTFQASAGAVSKPRLYWMLDKSGSIPTNVTLEGLKDMGARPKEIDENPKVISWAPSVLTNVYDPNQPNSTVGSQYRITPWLATSDRPTQPGWIPSTVDHLGIYWYMDMFQNPEGYQYQIDCEVQFEFKKPITKNIGEANAVPAQ